MRRRTHAGSKLFGQTILWLCFLWLCLSAGIVWGARQSVRPNIVLVMCDDLGWGDVGFNGGKTITTPHLDAMAAAGMRFTRFYAASAVCSPTRGSVITGRHPCRYGIPGANRGHMIRRELTIAELLKEVGYETGHFGKWHLGTLTKTVKDSNRGGPRGAAHYSPPWNNGFDVCFSTEAKVPTYDPMLGPRGAMYDPTIRPHRANGRSWNPIQDKTTAVPYGTHYWNERGKIVRENLAGDDSRIIMDRVVPFIEKSVANRRPFFAVVWFHAPHLPVVAGPKYAAMYPDAPSSYHRNYYGCVSAMDQQIGRLRATLRQLHVAEKTLVAFCSDNGPEGDRTAPGSAGPLRGRKRDLFEGGVRVPGLLEWPAKIRPGSVTDYPAVTSDYLPTILDAVGADMPDGRPLDGISLLPVIAGQVTQRPTPIGFQFGRKVALTGNRYKIVKYGLPTATLKNGTNRRAAVAQQPGRDGYMLFDLRNDRAETRDLAARHPEIVSRMAATLEAWIASCSASSPDGERGRWLSWCQWRRPVFLLTAAVAAVALGFLLIHLRRSPTNR